MRTIQKLENQTKMPRLHQTLFEGILVLVLLLTPALAGAIEYQGLGGRPANPDPANPKTSSWFIYHLAAGEQKQDAVEVLNTTLQFQSVVVYPQDSIKSSDGGFALKQFGDERSEVGSWVKLYDEFPKNLATTSQDILTICRVETAKRPSRQRPDVMTWCQGKDSLEFDLPSLGSKTIPFVISVPASAEVGEHTGGILIQKKEPAQGQGQQGGIIISTRVGVRIYETVPGEIHKELALTKFTVVRDEAQHLIRVSLSLKNTGNVSVDASTDLTVADPLFSGNREVVHRDLQVLKDDELTTNFDITLPKIGILKFTPSISYQDSNGAGHNLSAPLTLWIIPWAETIAVALGLLLVLAALFIFWRLRKKKYSTAGWVDYEVQTGDTITALAGRLQLSWRVLAKANGIKAPFVLQPGQSIKLPAALPGSALAAKPGGPRKRNKKSAKIV